MTSRLVAGALAGASIAVGLAAPASAAPSHQVTLEGRAVLPARTFAPGPLSGTLLGSAPINGVLPPFPGQPVQGFSAVLDAGNGRYWAMADNGYGAEENSKDFLLRVYRITPDFATGRGGGRGTIRVGRFIGLRDPDGHVPFALERADRQLTGGDFDPESMREDEHGDLWFGDEFGPWLLHTDATGKLLEPPIALPGVASPQNPPVAPFNPEPTLRRSQGFEGMALGADGETLHPMLEGALIGDPDQKRRMIYEYAPADGAYTGQTWQYRMESETHAIGDFTQLGRDRFVVIERDNLQGAAARFKKLYVVDFGDVGEDGFLVKREVADLLHVNPGRVPLRAQPGDVGLGAEFAFPFQTIEDVLPLGRNRLLVLNDNNFPFSNGRNPAKPDANEAIVLRVPGLRG
jgi:hypothetical protein